MTIPDDMLMAYADGMLSPADMTRIAAIVQNDAHLAKKVEAFRAQRSAVQAVFAPILDQPPPQRLIDAANARASKSAPAASKWMRTGAAGMALAASFAAGFMIVPRSAPTTFEIRAAGVFAGPVYANALNESPSGETRNGVTIAMTMPSKDGAFCRAFITADDALEAVACTEGDAWRIVALNERPRSNGAAGYRTASGALSTGALAALEARRTGDPLGADVERAWLKQRATQKR